MGVLLGAPLRERRRPPEPDRGRMARVAAHVATAFHLRRLLTTTAAREALRAAAVFIDRARGPLRRRDQTEAVELWRALVAGRWSLIDQFDSDGRRYYVAFVPNR